MSITLTAARKIARAATATGYMQPTQTQVWVKCPSCRERVTVTVVAWAKPNERVAALREAIVSHLRDGDCEGEN